MMQKKDLRQYTIWVLVPEVESSDPNIRYYYDFSQSLQEYTDVFAELGLTWTWQPVTLTTLNDVISGIHKESLERPVLVLNLCDGDEVNGAPGISVIAALEAFGLCYTGAEHKYYDLTTSKITMKDAFDRSGVSTASWTVIHGELPQNFFDLTGKPAIIKPAVSGGSMGLTIRNVVDNFTDLEQRIAELEAGYRGWTLTAGGLFAETYLAGPEYTVLIVGDSQDPGRCIIYEPVERIFHQSLPEEEKFLSFDRLWEIYEDEGAMPGEEHFYTYEAVTPELRTQLKQLSLDAYCAVEGQGYGRIDIRMDSATGSLFVLEVNAQCGLSDDENYTSIGAILRVSNKTFTTLVCEIFEAALARAHSRIVL